MGLRYIEYIYLDSVCFKCHTTSSQCFNCCSLLFLADSNAGKFRICYLCDLGHAVDFKDKVASASSKTRLTFEFCLDLLLQAGVLFVPWL